MQASWDFDKDVATLRNSERASSAPLVTECAVSGTSLSDKFTSEDSDDSISKKDSDQEKEEITKTQ